MWFGHRIAPNHCLTISYTILYNSITMASICKTYFLVSQKVEKGIDSSKKDNPRYVEAIGGEYQVNSSECVWMQTHSTGFVKLQHLKHRFTSVHIGSQRFTSVSRFRCSCRSISQNAIAYQSSKGTALWIEFHAIGHRMCHWWCSHLSQVCKAEFEAAGS